MEMLGLNLGCDVTITTEYCRRIAHAVKANAGKVTSNRPGSLHPKSFKFPVLLCAYPLLRKPLLILQQVPQVYTFSFLYPWTPSDCLRPRIYPRGRVFANSFRRNAYMSQCHASLGSLILQTPYFFYNIWQVITSHVQRWHRETSEAGLFCYAIIASFSVFPNGWATLIHVYGGGHSLIHEWLISCAAVDFLCTVHE